MIKNSIGCCESDLLLANRVVASSKVVGGILFSIDHQVIAEQLPVGSSSNLV